MHPNTPRLERLLDHVMVACGFVAMLCVPMLLLAIVGPLAQYGSDGVPAPDFNGLLVLSLAFVCSTCTLVYRELERWGVKRLIEREGSS